MLGSEAGMKEYHLNYPSRDDPSVGHSELRHASDEEAIFTVLELSKGSPLELWEGRRFEIRFHTSLTASPAGVQPATASGGLACPLQLQATVPSP